MAANDDFPRGLSLAQRVDGPGTPSVTFPAVVGIAWVITFASFTILSGTGVSHQNVLAIGGTYYGDVIIPATADSKDSTDYSSKLEFPTNTAVTVGAGVAIPGSVTGTVVAEAYPI